MIKYMIWDKDKPYGGLEYYWNGIYWWLKAKSYCVIEDE